MSASPHQRDTPADGDRALHRSVFYHSEQQLVAAAVPFLRAATGVGAPVLAVLDEATQVLLTAELGPDAALVRWADPARWFTAPAHSVRRAWEFARDAGPRARILGEIPWAGRSEPEIHDWARYERAITVALPHTPVLCAYDARTLDPAVLTIGGQTHPVLRHRDTAGDTAAVPSETPTDRSVHRNDVGLRPAPPDATPTHPFGPAGLPDVRHLVTLAAVDAGLDSDRCFDVIGAANEAATNAIEHGGGHGTLRTWSDNTWLDIEVISPSGQITDALAGYLPPDPTARAVAACG